MPDETAASLLKYRTYHTSSGQDKLTREATTNQEWVFQETGGKKYTIKFDKNFIKKHLFTYSKKSDKVSLIAWYLWKDSGEQPGKDTENWLKAEQIAVNGKLEKTLLARAESIRCTTCSHHASKHKCSNCVHRIDKHTNPGDACSVGGCACARLTTRCNEAACTCADFKLTADKYGDRRIASGKGDNPLAGAATDKNTSIVLSKVPKADFEKVVVDSIKHEETAGFTWAMNDEKELKWDFGNSRKGAIVQVDLAQDSAHWSQLQGVYVKAKKIGNDPANFVYQVFHMETGGSHAPF